MGSADRTAEVIWISGASSGIGAALAASVPVADARVIGISRRPGNSPEHLLADLADPAGWQIVRDSFAEVLGSGVERATFLHFAGNGAPHGPAAAADYDEYEQSVLLNGASGQVLGQAFLRMCGESGTPCRLVLCSSPAALEALYGMSHYNAAKAGYDRWAECLRLEVDAADATVFTVVPFAVDTPMLREVMELPTDIDPLGAELSALAERGGLATPEGVAAEVWELLDAGGVEAPAFVGAVPAELREGR